MNLPDITVMQWTMIWIKATVGLIIAAFCASTIPLVLLILFALAGGTLA